MANKSRKINGLKGVVQSGHRQLDKYTVPPLHELPLFAGFGHDEKEVPEMLEFNPPKDTQPPTELPDVTPPESGAPPVIGPCEPLADEILPKPAAKARKRKSQNRDGFVLRDPVPFIGPATAKSLIERIGTWPDVSESRRRDLITGVRNADCILSASRELVHGVDPWSCEGLNKCLWARSPRGHGLSAGSFRNMVSALRVILCRVCLHEDGGYGKNRLSPAWTRLHLNLPTDERRRAVVLFLRFLTLNDIEPDIITPSAIDQFEAWCRTKILCKDAGKMGRRVAGNWTFARQNVPGWPQVELSRAGMRDHYVIPLNQFPVSFQTQVKAVFCESAMGSGASNISGNPYSGLVIRARIPSISPADGLSGDRNQLRSPRSRRRALAPRTIETRLDQIMFAATALVRSGCLPIEEVTSLATLVTPIEHPFAILGYHLGRRSARLSAQGREMTSEDQRCSHLAGIGEMLRQIAKFHAPLPEDQFNELLDLIAQVKPEAQTQMSEKNMSRLKKLFEEPAYSMLLHLPRRWMKDASNPELKPKDAAVIAMYAAAVETLSLIPLRRGNLLELKLDTHLRRPNPKALINEISIPAATVKNNVPINWPVERESANLLEIYIRKYRPLLAAADNDFLFPGLAGSHRNADEFASTLSERVEADLGAEFNCHLARHFAVVRYLRANPGAYEVAAMILGHKNAETTRRFYCGLELDAAARHANAVLTSERRSTKIIAIGAFHRPRRRNNSAGVHS